MQRWRKRARIDQSAAAEHIGMRQSAYSKIERGKTPLSVVRLRALATLFEVSGTALAELLSDLKQW